MALFTYIELKYEQLTTQINTYLRNVYSRTDETFSNGSPFGQIINVLKELFNWNIIYQKNIVRNFQIEEADNRKAIRNLVRLGGHNPTRSISANGTLKLKLKSGVSLTDEISGGLITILDKTLLKNKTNGLNYSIRFNKSSEIFRVSHSSSIYVNIIQGLYEEQIFTGTGEINQSLSVNVSSLSEIDNFDVEVLYNNTSLSIKDSIYDMLRNEYACVVRTGLTGGIDIYFGNIGFGFVPAQGSIITVRYLLTNGTDGSILTPVANDFMFLTEVLDGVQNTINMDDNFDITIEQNLSFASNGESITFMKSILPNVSRNYVLSTPAQYYYTLSRLEFFSKINVYNTLNDNNFENDNKIFLFLVPKISNYFNATTNYFNIPLDAFYLDTNEQDKTITYLKRLGSITTNTVIEIIQPVLKKYVMYLYIRKFEGYSDDTIKQNIYSSVSDYLTTLKRDDRISRSEIISVIEGIQGIDGVNLTFISQENEEKHITNPTDKTLYGLDSVLGDIVVKKDELAIIRGGWSDRNLIYYNESLNSVGIGPINIIFVGITKI